MYKEYFANKRAVFFDLDGTLVDTRQQWLDAMTKAGRGAGDMWFEASKYYEAGVSTPVQWRSILKNGWLTTTETAEILTQRTFTEFAQLLTTGNLEPRLGFWDFIYELREEKKLKTALISSTPRQLVEQVVNKIGASKAFDLILCGDEVKRNKPNPEIYKKAAKMLGLKPKEVLVFEDSVMGAQSSTKAKMETIIIWDGVTEKFRYPQQTRLFLPDFSALPGNLDKTYVEGFMDTFNYLAGQKPKT